MHKSAANTHTTPSGLLHFPSLPCRDSGCINSSWACKFREPPWKENSATKGRDRHFQCCFVALQEAQRQPLRRQKLQVTEWALPTRREAAARSPYARLGRDAGAGCRLHPFTPLEFLWPQPAPPRLQGTAVRGQHPAATGAAQSSVPCAACLQHKSVPGCEEPHNARSTGRTIAE